MKEIWVAIIVLMFWSIVGCASVPPINTLKFDKPGATESDFKTDSYECERDAQMVKGSPYAYYGENLGRSLAISYLANKEFEKRQHDFYIRCMESKGWHRVITPNEESQPFVAEPKPDPTPMQ